MTLFYLYKIKNLIDHKVYIGVTKRPKDRWAQHKSKQSNCTKLKNAIAENGRDNFEFKIICIGSAEYIFDLEKKMIAQYDSVNFGYNSSSGGGRGGNIVLETRKTDSPVFVSGFWFPSDRLAYKTLNIPKRTFFQRKKCKILGDIVITSKPKTKRVGKPVYVRGFWIPTATIASEVFNISQTSVNRIHRQNTL